MRVSPVFWAAVLTVSCCCGADDEPAKLKGLLITGGCCHDYARQSLILTEGLSQRMNISWKIVHGKDGRQTKLEVYDSEDWCKGYDLVVHNECYGAVEDIDFVERIVRGHTKTGVAAVVIHCSMHTYRAAQTEEWRKLLGVSNLRLPLRRPQPHRDHRQSPRTLAS